MLVTSFANIFSQSLDCLFILFIIFFAVQKLLSVSGFQVFSFVYFHFSGRWIEKDVIVIYVRECLPVFSSRYFIVFNLTFKSLIILSLFLCKTLKYDLI